MRKTEHSSYKSYLDPPKIKGLLPAPQQRQLRILHMRLGGTIECIKQQNGKDVSNVLTKEEMLKLFKDADVSLDQVFVNDRKGRKIFKDSTEITPSDWARLASTVSRKIAENNYDGVLITHGTDTMAYTASALTYMLGEPSIPVVLTGSMKEFNAESTDAQKNLLDSINALRLLRPGVYVVFGGKIILGCRTSKVNNISFEAFESLNFPYVGSINGDKIVLAQSFDRRIDNEEVYPRFNTDKLRLHLPKLRKRGPYTKVANNIQKISCEPGLFDCSLLNAVDPKRTFSNEIINRRDWCVAKGDGEVPSEYETITMTQCPEYSVLFLLAGPDKTESPDKEEFYRILGSFKCL